MSVLDLTMYGCPMHYIKARAAINEVKLDEQMDLIVNKGSAVDEILNSLHEDGQQCDVVDEQDLTAIIRVKRKR